MIFRYTGKVPTYSNNVHNELTLYARNIRKWLILSNPFPNSAKSKLFNITLTPIIFPTIIIGIPLIIQLSFQVIVLNLLE